MTGFETTLSEWTQEQVNHITFILKDHYVELYMQADRNMTLMHKSHMAKRKRFVSKAALEDESRTQVGRVPAVCNDLLSAELTSVCETL